MAPELLAHATEPTAAADMYSLGATAYECATGGLPPRLGAGNSLHSFPKISTAIKPKFLVHIYVVYRNNDIVQ